MRHPRPKRAPQIIGSDRRNAELVTQRCKVAADVAPLFKHGTGGPARERAQDGAQLVIADDNFLMPKSSQPIYGKQRSGDVLSQSLVGDSRKVLCMLSADTPLAAASVVARHAMTPA